MKHIKINLNPELESKMRTFAKARHLSQSKWVEKLIEEKVKNEWPESIIKLAGAWKDFPDLDDIRRTNEKDSIREEI